MILIFCLSEQTKWIFSTFAEPVAVLLAVFLAYKYAIKQMRKESQVQIERERYKRTMDALQECWKLLAFLSPTENQKTIVGWVQNADKTKTYSFNKNNAQAFIHALADFFYGSGLGLYLPQSIKPLLFEYRSIIYGILLKEKNNPNNEIVLQNPEMINKMNETYDKLLKQLKDELGIQNPLLP